MSNLYSEDIKNTWFNVLKQNSHDTLIKIFELLDNNKDLIYEIDENGRNITMIASKTDILVLMRRYHLDFYNVDFVGRSTFDYFLSNGITIPDLNLLRSKITPKKYNNIPILNTEVIDPKLRRILLNDDVEMFGAYSDKIENSILLHACMFKAFNIAKMLILSNNEDYIFYKDQNGCTALTYLFYYDENLIIESILKNRDFNLFKVRDDYGNFPFSYGRGIKCVKIKYEMIRHHSNNYKNEILYKGLLDPNSFIETKFLDDRMNTPRCNISFAVHNQTGKRYTLKKLHLDNKSDISSIFVNEVLTQKLINEMVPSFAPNIYGYYITNDHFVIVMEEMLCTLQSTITFLLDDKKYTGEIFKPLFKEILELMDLFSKTGFIHRDIKLNNIMFDYNGNVKIIDFGLTQFIGLGMQKEKASTFLDIAYIYPHDYFGSIELNVQEYKVVKLNTNRKSLNIDVFSLASSLINFIFNTEKQGAPSYTYKTFAASKTDDLIFYCNVIVKPYQSTTKWYIFEPTLLDYLPNYFQLYDLFKYMLLSDSKERFYFKDCLEHPYFVGYTSNNPTEREQQPGSLAFITRPSTVTYTDSPYERCYQDDIVSNYQSKKNYFFGNDSIIVRSDMYYKIVEIIFNIFLRDKNKDVDIIYNFLGRFGYFITSKSFEDDYNLFITSAVAIYVITDCQYEGNFSYYSHEILKRCEDYLRKRYDHDYTSTMIKNLLNEEFMTKFLPVTTLVYDRLFKLYDQGFNNISSFEKNFMSKLIYTQLYINFDMTISEIIDSIENFIFNRYEDVDSRMLSLLNNIFYERFHEYCNYSIDNLI